VPRANAPAAAELPWGRLPAVAPAEIFAAGERSAARIRIMVLPSPIAEVARAFPVTGELPSEAHPKIGQLISYWKTLAPRTGVLPGRQDFDPTKVHLLMPHLWLVDIVPSDERRYRARLVGGALQNAGSPVRRGQFFTDVLTPEEMRTSKDVFDRVSQEKLIDWRRGPSVLRHLAHIAAIERVLMPLASDGQTVDVLLCMTLFYWMDGRVF
jgi:hypothetical protein